GLFPGRRGTAIEERAGENSGANRGASRGAHRARAHCRWQDAVCRAWTRGEGEIACDRIRRSCTLGSRSGAMTSSATQWPAHGCAIRSVDPACAEEMPQILYIMGTGRSGTTILEVLLANEKDIVGSGELKHIFRDAFLRNLPCACGKRSHACEWWSAVRKETGWSDADCRRYRDAIEAIERHRNFLRILSGCVLRHEWDVYEQGTTTLFRALGRLSRARVVVDSSKYPGRALMLARLFPRHVRVLCITRSAYGLIAAFQKQNDEEQRPKHPIAAAAYYVYVLLCM